MKIANKIRQVLRESPEGLSAKAIAAKTNSRHDGVCNALPRMPDAYIDRWLKDGTMGRPRAVWCVVVPPPHCPPPEKGRTNLRRKAQVESTETQGEPQ